MSIRNHDQLDDIDPDVIFNLNNNSSRYRDVPIPKNLTDTDTRNLSSTDTDTDTRNLSSTDTDTDTDT